MFGLAAFCLLCACWVGFQGDFGGQDLNQIPLEVMALHQDGYNNPKQRPVDQYTVLMRNGTVKKFFDIDADGTVEEIWKPAVAPRKSGWNWHTEFQKGNDPDKNEIPDEQANALFALVLKTMAEQYKQK